MFTGMTAVGWEPSRPGILTDGHTAILKHLHHLNRLITVLCLKSSVDICRFYTFVHKKLHHHTLFHARTNTVVCH
ncbi:unnamed protein product, partial [Staurois parvus]